MRMSFQMRTGLRANRVNVWLTPGRLCGTEQPGILYAFIFLKAAL